MIHYEKLWDQMQDQGVSQYFLVRDVGLSPSVITRLRHNRGVSTHTLNTFCEILHCRLDEIAEYTKDAHPNYVRRRKRKSAKHKDSK